MSFLCSHSHNEVQFLCNQLIEPYGTRLAPEPHSHSDQKCDGEGSLLEKEDSHVKSKSNLRSTTPDSESKEIKTIYVDSKLCCVYVIFRTFYVRF